MSSLMQPVPAATDGGTDRLAELRGELDRLDDALHDDLMRRAEIVAQVAALHAKGAVPLRPGREAAILRRLLGRHAGALPLQGVVRLWRELFSATVTMQRPFVLAVCDEEDALALAREHFGALAPLHLHRSPAQALGQVAAGTAIAAILPVPAEGDAAARAWWTGLLHGHAREARLHIVARLPFWAPRPEGAPRGQAFVVTAAFPDPSGMDRSLLAIEVPQESSRGRLAQALAAAGLSAGSTILRRDPGITRALVDIDGFLEEADPRLAAIHPQPVVIGAYAVPVGEPP